MNALTLWATLLNDMPAEADRLHHLIEPVSGSAQDLIERLLDFKLHAMAADMKCGTDGNPHEQDVKDFCILIDRAESISGIKGRNIWERS